MRVKAKVIAGCVGLLCCQLASGQTAQLYGVADMSIDIAKGSSNVVRLKDGEHTASRWGLRISEDLGGGLRAMTLLEAGINLDTGMENFGNGRIFGRQAYVGLASNTWGQVRLGRQFTPAFYVLSRLDPYMVNGAVSPLNLLNAVTSQGTGVVAFNVRFDNAVQYMSPKFGGASFTAAIAPGETAGNTRAGLNLGMNAMYESQSLYAFYAYQGMHNPSPALLPGGGTALTSNHFAGMSYKFGDIELGILGATARSRAPGTRSSRHAGLTMNWQVTKQDVLKAAALKRYVRNGNQPLALTLGWDHSLSQRTALYTRAVYVHNSAGGNATLNAIPIAAGSGDSGTSVALGIRHRF
jgi:GBP family porin